MRYLDTWLAGLNLEYVIPKLKANGITTPKKLATLTLRDIYEVVGVESSEDRKKLFFLIQRLQTILHNKSNGADASGTASDDADDDSEPASPPVAEQPVKATAAEKPRPKSQMQRPTKPAALEVNEEPKPTLLRTRSATAYSEPVKRVEAVLQHKQLEEPAPAPTAGIAVAMETHQHQHHQKQQRSDRKSISGALLTPPSPRTKGRLLPPQMGPLTVLDDPAPAPMGGNYDMAIRVVVRKRPLSKGEALRGDKDVLEVAAGGVVLVHEPKVKVDLTKVIETQAFVFDDSFGSDESNRAIYGRTVRPLVHFVFQGGKASCFAYGQTGSGKTFSMMGSNPHAPLEQTENAGLYALAGQDLFQQLAAKQLAHAQVLVSCFEIYGGKLFDLLNGRAPVRCLEDAKQMVRLPELSSHPAHSAEELMALMAKAHGQRSTGSTGANAESSRSHQILQIVLRDTRKGGARAAWDGGKLSFIDLAGSERGADTHHASKQTRLEGAEINTSLLALKEVIRSLERKQGHTPFRGSKLTQVLKDSFVGDKSRTCMMACVSPSHSNCEHTLNTLRYADRVKEHSASNGNGSSNGHEAEANPSPPLPQPHQHTQQPQPYQHTQQPQRQHSQQLHQPHNAHQNGQHVQQARSPPTDPPPVPKGRPLSLPITSTASATTAGTSHQMISPERLSPSASHTHAQAHRALFPSREKENVGLQRAQSFRESKSALRESGGAELIQKTVSLLAAHKLSIAEMVEVMKDEMELVQEMENVDDRDSEIYVDKLEKILEVKSVAIYALKHELDSFQRFRSL